MPTLNQIAFTGGEISPSLFARVDLARYATSLRTCRNFIVRATGGISNRPGLEYVATLNAESESTLIPFIFNVDQAYILVLQEETIQVYSQGAFVQNITPVSIANISGQLVIPITSPLTYKKIITTADPHGLSVADQVTISGVSATGWYVTSGSVTVREVLSATEFSIGVQKGTLSGSYASGGIVEVPTPIPTDYLSDDLAAIRYTQSADIVTLVHQDYEPSEFVRTGATTFTFDAIADFENGPFLDFEDTDVTVTASAATGIGITLTASSSIFDATHVGALFRLDLEDISGIAPWEASKEIAAVGANPVDQQRRANGKVYKCVTDEVAASFPIYTGTVRPAHDEGIEEDGDGNPITDLASRAGVEWEYLHSFYGVARITAVAGTTATADVLSYIPVISPATTTTWAFGAWSEDQGYPATVTYYSDRLGFARTPEQPQTQWLSKVGEYHDFGESSPRVDDDAITQTLNAKQVNAIVELVPLDQLVSLTASSSWASPQRGEVLTPNTIGFFPQSNNGAADLRSLLVGDYGALFAMYHSTKVRELKYDFSNDKYSGDELTVLARHLFGPTKTIVDWDYAAEPHGIVWIVRSDGVLIGLTYLPEQQVIGWHRHDTDGYFERVCVIPEDGRDAVYVVVRRTVNGSTARYLERMADREFEDQLDGFFVDSGLSYDGRNTTATTITVSGPSYEGGDEVTLTASSSVFSLSDVGDVIQFDSARILITAFSLTTTVSGELQTPLPEALQATASSAWTFARTTFTGLDHLEGREVAICADGAALARQTVENGAIELPYAYGVVHIGLPFVSQAETLDVTVFGSPESVRDRPKNIPNVTLILQDSVGLQVGIDENNLETPAIRDTEFYTDPTRMLSGTAEAHIANTWNDSGRILMQQSDPLPATILGVLPTVKFGDA